MQFGDALAQGVGATVGVAMPVHLAEFGSQGIAPGGGRREGRLVGVEAHPHLDLRRVVALQRTEVVAHGYSGHGDTLPTDP